MIPDSSGYLIYAVVVLLSKFNDVDMQSVKYSYRVIDF